MSVVRVLFLKTRRLILVCSISHLPCFEKKERRVERIDFLYFQMLPNLRIISSEINYIRRISGHFISHLLILNIVKFLYNMKHIYYILFFQILPCIINCLYGMSNFCIFSNISTDISRINLSCPYSQKPQQCTQKIS